EGSDQDRGDRAHPRADQQDRAPLRRRHLQHHSRLRGGEEIPTGASRSRRGAGALRQPGLHHAGPPRQGEVPHGPKGSAEAALLLLRALAAGRRGRLPLMPLLEKNLLVTVDGYDLAAERERYRFDDVTVGGLSLNRGRALIEVTGDMNSPRLV